MVDWCPQNQGDFTEDFKTINKTRIDRLTRVETPRQFKSVSNSNPGIFLDSPEFIPLFHLCSLWVD